MPEVLGERIQGVPLSRAPAGTTGLWVRFGGPWRSKRPRRGGVKSGPGRRVQQKAEGAVRTAEI